MNHRLTISSQMNGSSALYAYGSCGSSCAILFVDVLEEGIYYVRLLRNIYAKLQ